VIIHKYFKKTQNIGLDNSNNIPGFTLLLILAIQIPAVQNSLKKIKPFSSRESKYIRLLGLEKLLVLKKFHLEMGLFQAKLATQ
jgi:hypothetical protein